MKIAVIYNRQSKQVINLFGVLNREKYALKSIKRIVDYLRKGGHQVVALEGDKALIGKLEEFMPRVLQGERPGMAFNLSYGIQGEARYTHVPGILEMLGIPYVGSGPLAHSLALDKVVAKMLFRQNNLPTPDFAVLDSTDCSHVELRYPLIVKPKNEAVSMGIQIVHNRQDLEAAVGKILEDYGRAALVEEYIEGREINVGLLGNHPVEAFWPAELMFGEEGPRIYTYEDKRHTSGRHVGVQCPAELSEEQAARARELAIKAFRVLGCYDCARVDMRLDTAGNFFILEINSLPSLGEHGSYVQAAAAMGMDFCALVNRMVDVASARYFGTPHPPMVGKEKGKPSEQVFAFLTKRRDDLEKRIEQWTGVSSRTDDPVGKRLAAEYLGKTLLELGLQPVPALTDLQDVWTWETHTGMEKGILLVCHVDVPVNPQLGAEHFHRTPEWLYGEGIGCSRAPLTMLEFSLRALRHIRQLQKLPLGVMVYADEGRNCEASEAVIRQAVTRARGVLSLTAGNPGDHIVTGRRGHRIYRLVVEGKPLRLGQKSGNSDVMRPLLEKLTILPKVGSQRERLAVSVIDIRAEAYPRLLPHRVVVRLQVSYPHAEKAGQLEEMLREIFVGNGLKWHLSVETDRTPMKDRPENHALLESFQETAAAWKVPLKTESSIWPSMAGLVPETTPVLCGLGPVAKDLFTSRECVSRISLVQRTLLLAQFLLQNR